MNNVVVEAVQRISKLDLEPIVFKLTASEYGQSPEMTLAEADHAVALYRQFLVLKLLHPEKSLVPTRLIDAAWHTHILDTGKYREDCEWAFGRFIDHFPYLGLRGEEDERNWRQAASETRELFRKYFGVTLSVAAGMCNGGCDEGSQCVDFTPDRARPRPDRSIVTM